MILLYLDESGNPRTDPTSSHYVLLGLAVHEQAWSGFGSRIDGIRDRYRLGSKEDLELHAHPLLSPYVEQDQIAGFETLTRPNRHAAVVAFRATMKPAYLARRRPWLRKTLPYVHLTRVERGQLVDEVLDVVNSHKTAGGIRLFAEVIDKAHMRIGGDPLEQAFEQVVARFEAYLRRHRIPAHRGMLIIDRNDSVAGRLRSLLASYQTRGTIWRKIDRVIETPFFADSRENVAIQAADLCGYVTRRLVEKDERGRFRRIFDRFDRAGGRLHGLRHYTAPKTCTCLICAERGH